MFNQKFFKLHSQIVSFGTCNFCLALALFKQFICFRRSFKILRRLLARVVQLFIKTIRFSVKLHLQLSTVFLCIPRIGLQCSNPFVLRFSRELQLPFEILCSQTPFFYCLVFLNKNILCGFQLLFQLVQFFNQFSALHFQFSSQCFQRIRLRRFHLAFSDFQRFNLLIQFENACLLSFPCFFQRLNFFCALFKFTLSMACVLQMHSCVIQLFLKFN
mmetsp:Transcript_9516/g.17175  ORF Transcript_9516/g.17175 Transcript_9516/m.17175 type:complete len:216 (-) Transcript_9516:247-894(-)